MRYALIREMDISNGEGVGVSLFVQGCHFHCKGCFNQETWDFEGGKPWTPEIQVQFLKLLDRPYIKRVSILGGEPLADENLIGVLALVESIRMFYPEKKLWLYTGYNWEHIMQNKEETPCNILRKTICSFADVIVDGRFQIENQDLFNKEIIWAGSTNQRVIDVSRSTYVGQVVLYEG